MDSLNNKTLKVYLSNLKPLFYKYLYSRMIIAAEFFMLKKEDESGIMPKPHALTCGQSNKLRN